MTRAITWWIIIVLAIAFWGIALNFALNFALNNFFGG